MILRPLVRILAFRVISLFWDVPCVYNCMFFRRLGKHLLLQLNEGTYYYNLRYKFSRVLNLALKKDI